MKTRIEHDLLGNKEVPMDAYYGVQTLRAIENFAGISNYTIGMFPNYVTWRRCSPACWTTPTRWRAISASAVSAAFRCCRRM